MHPRRKFLDWFRELGFDGIVGLSGMLSAILLVFVWVYLVRKHHRPFYLLAGSALLLATSGYVVFERDHVLLNLSMRDPQEVREDCVQLMQRRDAMYPDSGQALQLYKREELPASFVRLGAKSAWVTSDNVQISLRTYPMSGSWGFLFDPTSAYQKHGWPDRVRATWYRDFHEYTVMGE